MKAFPILTLALSVLLAPLASAQSNPPTLTIANRTIQPRGGNHFSFVFSFDATDDGTVEGIEFRGRVNGKPFDNWRFWPDPGAMTDFPVELNCFFFHFQVRAVDDDGNRSAVVDSVFALKPVFTGSNKPKGKVGGNLRFKVHANNASAYSAKGLPAGLRINPRTGVITGKPKKAGLAVATITARNPGNSAERVFMFRISN